METIQRKNTNMTCLLNELEYSVMPHLNDHNAVEPDTLYLQRSMDDTFMIPNFCELDNNVGLIPHSMLGVFCLNVLRLGCSPSMLAPLWDYFIISGSRHKGYFLLLALLLREKEKLLALEEQQLQSHLKDVLSGSGLVSSLKDTSKLDTLLKEVRDLDWQTPQSFCHFVNKAVMQTAVAEYSRLDNCSRVSPSNIFESCHEMPHPTEGPPVGYSAPSSFDIDFEMGLPSMFVTESKVTTPCEPQSPHITTTSTEGVTAKTTVKASKGRKIASRIATGASQAVIGVNQRIATFLNRTRRNKRPSSADGNKGLPHNIPQICLYCTPHEMIISIGLKTGLLSANNRNGAPFGTTPSDRMSCDMYFPIDCRSETARSNEGWFKHIFHFDLESVENENDKQLVLNELQPIFNNKHICLMGEGVKEPHHYEDGNQQQVFSKAAEEDCGRVDAFATFLMKNGFLRVSVVHGGFAAVHNDLASEQIPGMSLSILTDHSPSLCDLCKHCRRPELLSRAPRTFFKSK